MAKKFSIFFAILILVGLLAPLTLAQDEPTILHYPITAEPENLNPFIADTIAIGRVGARDCPGDSIAWYTCYHGHSRLRRADVHPHQPDYRFDLRAGQPTYSI
jgi:hypothetical protein